VIAVFTKYDYFRCNIGFKLEDQSNYPTNNPALLNAKVKKVFQEQYLANLKSVANLMVKLGDEGTACMRGKGSQVCG
jgi:hypothetical protein